MAANKLYKGYKVCVLLDESSESKEAKRLLDESGIPYEFEIRKSGDEYLRPTLLWGRGIHEGLESIKAWLASGIPENQETI